MPQSINNMQATWGTATQFTGIKYDVVGTDNSLSTSLLMDLQVGGASRLLVSKTGRVDMQGDLRNYASGGGIRQLSDTGYFSMGVVDDVVIRRDAANTLAQRNSTNAQTFRLYNTTDAGLTNFERAKFAWETNVLRIGTEKGGTGTARSLEFQTDGTTRLTIQAAGTVVLNANLSLGANYVIGDTASGNKIGTAANQKLAFWGATPIVQPTTAVAAATTAATGTGDVVAASTTFDGYTIPQVVKALRNAGLLA